MKTLTGIIAALLLATVAGPAAADGGAFRSAPVVELVQNCASLSDAVERVRRRYNGRIVSAETRRQGNREVHHIRVVTEDGKVKTVRIPGCPLDSRG